MCLSLSFPTLYFGFLFKVTKKKDMELPGNTRDEVSESDTEKVLILNRVSINVKGKKMDRVTEYVGLCKFVSLPKEIYT